MSSLYERRLQALQDPAQAPLLAQIRRGVEKESLRITSNGRLAQTPHPRGLGSALTHSHITTDYSEALLEFITPPSEDIERTLQVLDEIHRFVYGEIDGELLWAASMPCLVEGEDSIPVARYGSSNIANMKTIYRYGLGHRYGRVMQTIAGIHYNFSMPEAFWPQARLAEGNDLPLQDYITDRYLGLIRNFQRYSWLLIYLFGASPAVCRSFVRDIPEHGLQDFDSSGNSLYLPHATALRMGDLGYNSKAQKNLSICYNSLDTYIETLHSAITLPHPAYEEIGVGPADARQQLNTSLLQIENEFYSPIRPKRVTRSGEIPLGALRRRGIEYIEVRCIDINPFMPLGLDGRQMRFIDTFLLYCLLKDSPACTDTERACMARNMERVVNRGREPGLQLDTCSKPIELRAWATELLDALVPVAGLLDDTHGGTLFSESLASQRASVDDPELTPSAQILRNMREQEKAWFHVALDCSRRWSEEFLSRPLNGDRLEYFRAISEESLADQSRVEAADDVDFDTFLANYFRQYQELHQLKFQ